MLKDKNSFLNFLLILVLSIITILGLVWRVNDIVKAQEVNTEEIIRLINKNLECGDATNSKYRRCCNKEDIKKAADKVTDIVSKGAGKLGEKVFPIPKVGGAVIGGGAAAVSKTIVNIALSSFPDKYCQIGNPVTTSVKGGEYCVCKFEAFKGIGKAGRIEFKCDKISSDKRREKCSECIRREGYYSAIGCIPFSQGIGNFLSFFLNKLVLIGSFLTFLCIIYSAVQIQVSAGDTKKVEASKERIQRCVMGLLMILFSVFIIYLVGKFGIISFISGKW